MSSDSVRSLRSLTQKPEQSKPTNPHCIAPSTIAEVNEEELIRTLWKLTQIEFAYLFIAGK